MKAQHIQILVAIAEHGSLGAAAKHLGHPNRPRRHLQHPFIDNNLIPREALTTSESNFGALSLVESLGAVCTFPTLLMPKVQRTWHIAPLKTSLITRASHPLTPTSDMLAMCIRRRVASMQKDGVLLIS
ncbi:MAG: LysR family transcriptional regulator [Paracoccaceae bacterium]